MQFWIPSVVNCLWYYVFKIKVFENSNSSSFSSSSNIVQSSSWALSHYCHCCYDNKGAHTIYRCKLKQSDGAIMGWCSPIPLKHLGVLSTNGCGRLLHILILSGKKKCLQVDVLVHWTRNRAMWPIAHAAQAGILLQGHLKLCTSLQLYMCHYHANSYHCSIFSKYATLLPCR